MRAINGGRESCTLLKNNNMSSAYSAMRSSKSPYLNPPRAADALTMHANGSSANANRNGDRGQPCRVPLPKLNGLDSFPFTRILALGSEYISCTHLK
ncbi:hypothetical protein GDO81_027467 [Engystomops pustulosus]|uniref:Uncharacterized protein n=1 Tax=Engystomops pustulosus TaxID=76066 RepID=A0AAV6YEE3_ENGPU|nr:hypothetical protein GDO81_027467 [Engystomops pustulosus]